MITSSELIQEVYEYVRTTPIPAAITGKVYKRARPRNSILEDVVLNSLTHLNGQLQRAVINANFFVPDVEVQIEGEVQKVADDERLETLEQLAANNLDEVTLSIAGQTVLMGIEQANVLKDEESDQHFINVRLNFFITNVN